MAIRKRKRLFYNFIWTILLVVMLALPAMGVMELSTLALEQETRCGQQEHNHTQECYFRDMLMCEQKAHNHSENCYLVLLADNDINWLLSTIENTEEKSLENVIDSAMVQALNLNPNLTSANSQQIHLAADNVRQLNDVIAENHIEPAVVLNENIRDNYLSYTPPQPEPEKEAVVPTEEIISPTENTAAAENSATTAPVQTEPPVTTEETEPSETTEATEPTETTETTEPPATTEETEPPATTEATEPPATTETTEPPATTETTEPPATTEATEPPATTETTEPPATTETTEPPATTETTEPPATTEATEPPATTEATEPPATTEATEPPATTETTEPPATTEATEPPATTEATEPPATTEATEPPATTEATEPPATTETTEPPVTTETTEPSETTEATIPSEFSMGGLMFAAPPANMLMNSAAEDDSLMTAELGGEPDNGRRKINFYIQLDGQPVFVNSRSLEVPWWGAKYCSYDTALGAYTTETAIITGLTTGNLGRNYWFYFNTSGDFSQNRTAATTYNNNFYFGSSDNAQYAILTSGNGNSYSPVNFYTVKLDYSAVGGTGWVQYVESGLDSTFTLQEEYLWYRDKEGTEPASAEDLKTIDSTTTLYAHYKNRTVTFETNGGSTIEPLTVQHGTIFAKPRDPVKDGFLLEGWYTDAALTKRFDFSTPVTENITLYANWAKRCTVSFRDGEGNPIREALDIGEGMELTLPEFYTWTGTDGQIYQGGDKVTIREDTVFTGEIYTYTITYYSGGSVHAVQENVPHGSVIELPVDPQLAGHRFLGWYADEAYTQLFDRNTPIVGETKLYAQWGFDVTLNYLDLQGNLKKYDTLSKISGDTITLPEHYTWTDSGDGTIYPGGQTIPVLRAMILIGEPERYTVTYVDQSGNTAAETVTLEYGSSFFFPAPPEGCVWEGSDGSHYIAGDYYDAVVSDLTFTAVETSVTIHYNVNFPSGAVSYVDAVPTLNGTTAATASDNIPGGKSATVRSLTSNTARREVSAGNKESVTYYFKGWEEEGTDTLIPADTVLTWSVLSQYADAQGNIRLNGKWEDGSRFNSVTFFVQFNSVAVDTEGNIGSHPTSDYTHEIFNTYLGGVPSNNESELRKYQIADTTSDNSYTADQKIRQLYGERPDGIWMYEFPLDDNIFAYLKEYLRNNPSKSLTVDGEAVKLEELDAKHYAIRWYVFKLEGSSWHVDGKLVRREGLINIYKYFQGEDAAITKAEDGFYILTENGTMDASGNFTPYATSHSHFKQYVLTLDDATINALRSRYPKATFVNVTQHNAHTNFWRIRNVLLDELWRVTEYVNGDIDGYSHYAEYSIYDSDGELTAIAEYGTQASVVGKTFALDEDPDQGLTVEFTNYYFKDNSILLKKEDAATGAGIGGAGFRFVQKNNELSFEGTSEGHYSQNPNADNKDILTGANGYVAIEGFSYQYGADINQGERGQILIKESVVPEGYGQAPTVELGLDENDNVYIANVFVGETTILREEWGKYVELPRNDTLIIKNHMTDLISVTANKVWSTNVPADSVQVVLQANGQNAANIFPGLKNAQVKLDAGNNWTHTWEKLPRIVGGQPVSWGIKEVVVGNAPTLADGVSFANWIPSYSAGAGTDTNGDGKVDNWAYTVTNYSKTPKLILTKVGVDNEGLSGAIFTLEQVEQGADGWQRVRGTTPISQTTDASGKLTFENLVGTYTYRLTEVKAPANYIILIEPLVFTIDGNGMIEKLDDTGAPVPITGEFLKHESAYNLTVKNLIAVEMPETGGCGIQVYWLCGMALILTALLLYKLPARKEEETSF